jgi:hypothetical protein
MNHPASCPTKLKISKFVFQLQRRWSLHNVCLHQETKKQHSYRHARITKIDKQQAKKQAINQEGCEGDTNSCDVAETANERSETDLSQRMDWHSTSRSRMN